MNTQDYLSNYYQNYDEDSRLLSRHGMVEYITTMKYIEKYLQPGMRIIEIGAATGRYSHALARKDYQVDAVELVEHNIEIFNENTLPDEPIITSTSPFSSEKSIPFKTSTLPKDFFIFLTSNTDIA